MSPGEPARPSPFALREYALLADGERGALVDPHGNLAWLCLPHWDSPAVLSTLMDGRGHYAVTPVQRFVWGGYYEPGTLIWRSRWVTNDGIVECREALALPAKTGAVVILRRIAVRRGSGRLRVELHPRAQFGGCPLEDLTKDDAGVWRGRTGEVAVTWLGGADARPHAGRDGDELLVAELTLEEGDSHDLVLLLDTGEGGGEPPRPEAAWRSTETAWRERVPELENTAAQRDARHAYAVLAGLTSRGGGMVAAATTSLPERAREGRNYDYRYVWIRDQAYAGEAVAAAGPHPLMDSAVSFVRDRLLADGRDLRPAYTTRGGDVPDEHSLDVPGYPGGGDIAGNWVNSQFQLDAFGEALLLFAAAARHDHLDADAWRAGEIAADVVAERWQEEDAGIWELDPATWTHSRLICAAGLRMLSEHSPSREQAAGWVALADRIVADTAARAVHRSGRWQRARDDARVDAALVLPALRGAVAAGDPRSRATLLAVDRELTRDGYAYRYRPDERPLGESEGAFLVCGYWMSLAWAQQRDPVAATRWFERSRAACGPPGLFAEEYDITQRQLRGNLPQAFVHALLLECAAALHGFEPPSGG
jgi:GH15 family glucan-1,4-alpha-glucosidase